MKRSLFIAVSALAAAAGLAFGTASARAADVNVNLFGCVQQGGQRSVPAGSTIAIRIRNNEVNLGVLTHFLNAQTTTLSLDGGPLIDITGVWDSPAPVGDGSWTSLLTYPTGITLANAGDSVTATAIVSFSRRFAEVFNGPVGFAAGYSPGPPVFTDPGVVYFTDTCTITAV